MWLIAVAVIDPAAVGGGGLVSALELSGTRWTCISYSDVMIKYGHKEVQLKVSEV